jgi:hypothetical protein
MKRIQGLDVSLGGAVRGRGIFLRASARDAELDFQTLISCAP